MNASFRDVTNELWGIPITLQTVNVGEEKKYNDLYSLVKKEVLSNLNFLSQIEKTSKFNHLLYPEVSIGDTENYDER